MHKPRYRWVFGWALALLGLAACTHASHQLPMMARPDTRYVLTTDIDSGLIRRIAELLADSLPHENGLCLTLAIGDTTFAGAPWYTVAVVGARQAAVDRADEAHVWFQQRPYRNGCDSQQQFAMAHSHPYAIAPHVCTNSRDDEIFLASDPRLLFSLIFCGDGRGEILWQDAERDSFWWARPDSSESP